MSNVYSFSGGGTAEGPNGLVQAADGNIYGTTQNGAPIRGARFTNCPRRHAIRSLSVHGRQRRRTATGRTVAGCGRRAGGTAFDGGLSDNGTVFNFNTNGLLTTLAGFNITNGDLLFAGLIPGTDGRGYGTTYQGGNSGFVLVYRMTPRVAAATTLCSFTGGNDVTRLVRGGVVRGH